MIAANYKVVRCCVKCDECSDCYTHTLYDIRDLLTAINYHIANFGKQLGEIINNGYGCTGLTEIDVTRLMTYKRSILRYYHNLRTKAMSCLCDIEFQKTKEKVLRIIDLRQCFSAKVEDIRYDYSAYDQWVAQNPNCVAYDVWEKGIITCNPSFVITVTLDERVKVTRTLHALVTKDNTNCVTKLLAYAHKATCERKLTAAAAIDKKCVSEFNILVQKHKCKMELSTYAKLLSCNLSFNVVSTILGCGGKISLNSEGVPMVRISGKVAKIEDVVKLAGGTWPVIDNDEFNNIYG